MSNRAILAALCGLLPLASAATKIDLNQDWRFRVDPEKQGEASGWYRALPAGTETVSVPHTWNIGKHEEFLGRAWYFKTFTAPPGKHVELHFGATFYRSQVWLNGAPLGSHEGGHTAYFFDVTPHLKPLNFLAVAIDNEPGVATIPGWAMLGYAGGNIWYDWWHYGGIVRDVWLAVNEPLLIRRQEIRTQTSAGAAEVADRVFLENHTGSAADVRLRLSAWAPGAAAPSATAERDARIAPGRQDVAVPLRINPVELWHFDRPALYRLEASLLDAGGALLDSVSDNYGVRTVEISNTRLVLNGEPVRLSGMTRHEESPWEGLAETAGTMKRDFDEMKELQVTLTRPVHYPQHPYILDYCDRNGILLIPEIPMWQFSEEQMRDPKVIALARQMMTEMIEQSYNHPSIFAWSVCNESATNTPGGRAYFRTMYETVKKLDPDRYVSYADDKISKGADPAVNAASIADFVMMNQYFGSWHGPAGGLVPALERVRREYPGKMVLISEFGFAGPFAPDNRSADRIRERIIREQMDVFGNFDFVGGAIFWCYQDYRSHRNLRPGRRSGFVEMGVVDQNRQRNPSFYAWRKRNAPARLQLDWLPGAGRPSGFRAVIAPRGENEIPHYTLRGYRAEFAVLDHSGKVIVAGERALPDIGPAHQFEVPFAESSSREVTLEFRLVRPTGFVAADEQLRWWEPESGGYRIEDMKKDGHKVP